ncbi:DNA mismatch repair endonuclease MutL [Alteromonas sp. a30]|uniref:DNA mismatch repair endonuclease MutL n=1 Tax=Alteromonas sp. a30 TaxID=2730917 RepID=UPI002281E408|nr:DNA mismatch repair endonuclease MutL [Alteromonas sp. a30]MCY7294731.1 DNA mismatch repair endonuclease MutL [Alteromonas sp. a30]
MSIKILPARLANQIAAGEVVERPASVVKELLENSIDAGATKIEVEVIKGGHKRVLIRDNGKGIVKDELMLALSRHATSKIATLEDLESIASLGFRGEALASISSVSRLTLTSRPEEQKQAWQAQCEGRDMEVVLTPAAHPKGTSVDVQDLFFNTPARRKFLRTEKTEFTHIDELFKRAALSHYDIHFTLRHNDKVVRNFPVARSESARLKRATQICGRSFEQSAIEFSSQYQDIQFEGWITTAEGARSQNDQQYVYINGRMMRDKLIAHAIRQAYDGLIASDMYPAYVVYLSMPTHMLDVNVHPTKQEVRFHQARLVHDFIYKAVNDTLQQQLSQMNALVGDDSNLSASTHDSTDINVDSYSGTASEHAAHTYSQLHDEQATHQYIKPLQTHDQIDEQPAYQVHQQAYSSSSRQYPGYQPEHKKSGKGFEAAAQNYQRLMQASPLPKHAQAKTQQEGKLHQVSTDDASLQGLFTLNEHNMLVRWQSAIYICAPFEIERLKVADEFRQHVPVSQPLLMPVAVSINAEQGKVFNAHKSEFSHYNIELVQVNKKLVLRQIPAGYRHLDWANAIHSLLDDLATGLALESAFINCIVSPHKCYSEEQQFSLWQWFESHCEKENVEVLSTALPSSKQLDFTQWLVCHEQ